MIRFTILGISILLVVATALSIADGFFLDQNYLKPWQKSYSDQFTDPRIKLAACGLLAANGHNMQPWKVSLDKNKNVFYLFADNQRLSQEVDTSAQQVMITQGTFLEYVRVGGNFMGYKTNIILFPDGEYDEGNLTKSMQDKPVAKITLSLFDSGTCTPYEYMFQPDTNRGAYENQELTPEELQQFFAINSSGTEKLDIFQDRKNKRILDNYVLKGAEIESGIHRISKESADIFRKNEYEKNKYRYGFSVEGQGISGLKKYFVQGMLTLFPFINSEKISADMYMKTVQEEVNNTPAYGLIITTDNSRTEQVKSGMLYSRLVLEAHALGLAVQPMSQVIEEYPEMKEQHDKIHRDYAQNGDTIQMFFRIGRPVQEFPRSMRRDVMELIEK
ncbi:hypothetical protein [Pectinatus frisingensis]|uniref:hypothetical protein n=1 Tax=Pectinatus frisingensis TaxID=865 RepID=UPI0018C85665|nr:hypothetical protein [Pectinatus frisingensis]